MRKLLLLSILSLIVTALSPSLRAETKTDEYDFTGRSAQSYITLSDLPNLWSIANAGSTSSTIITPETDPTAHYTYFQINKTNGIQFYPSSDYSYIIIPVKAGTLSATVKGTNFSNAAGIYLYSLIKQGDGTFKAESTSLKYASLKNTTEKWNDIPIKEDGYVAFRSNSKYAALMSFSNTYEVSEESTYTLTGTVRSYDNLVMRGIDVNLLEGADTRTVQTDAEGKFTFNNVFTNMPTITINQNGYMPYSQSISDITPTNGTYDWGTITLQQLHSYLNLTVDGSDNKYFNTDITNNYAADFYGAVFTLYRVPQAYNPEDDADKSILKSFISDDNIITSKTYDAENTKFEFIISGNINSDGYILTCTPDDFTYNTFEPIFVPVYDAIQTSNDTPYIIQYTETNNEFNLFSYFLPKTFEITGTIYEWDGDRIQNDGAYINLKRSAPNYDAEGGIISYTEVTPIPFTQDSKGIFTYTGDIRASRYFKYQVACGFNESVFGILHPNETFLYKGWLVDDLEEYAFDGRDVEIRAIAYPEGAYSIDGTLLNEWNSPVGRATVEVFNAGVKCGLSCETGANGKFHIIYAAPDEKVTPEEPTPESAPRKAPADIEDDDAEIETDPTYGTYEKNPEGYYVKVTPENDLYKPLLYEFEKPTDPGNTKTELELSVPSGTITGIESVVDEEATAPVTINGSDINVAGTSNIEVFNISGARCGHRNLPSGIYIVRVEGRSYKLLIP